MQRRWNLRRVKIGGFTLIELMIAVGIGAILASIAYGAYNNSVRKSRRTEAKTALLDLAGREERLFSTSNTYSLKPSDLGYTVTGDTMPMSVGNGYYTINVTNVAVGPPSTYTATATAVASQAKDTECATFTITQTGVQTSTGGGTCW